MRNLGPTHLKEAPVAGLGLPKTRAGEEQSRIQTQFLERKDVSQRSGAQSFAKWRDSGQRDKPKSLLIEGVLRRTHVCAARVVPELSDQLSAERSDFLG